MHVSVTARDVHREAEIRTGGKDKEGQQEQDSEHCVDECDDNEVCLQIEAMQVDNFKN